MTELAIKMDRIGKLYQIGALQKQHQTLREATAAQLASPFRRALRALRSTHDEPDDRLWALRDVSFELKRGQVLGVIGRNGAGKSTLLKVLSRVTGPTEGTMGVKGRIASLLEVGTGFHPELTGRDNVFLNGAVLGMKRAEVARKFDEIIAFAELERFVDTQVKHYSSGMYMRLAFAVAAHLEPDILVVDEVLAVGDAAFQKKCLGQMRHRASGGVTVLFVSHNISAISQLCSDALWLDGGRVCELGPCSQVVGSYLRAQEPIGDGKTLVPVDYSKAAQLRNAWCTDTDGERRQSFLTDEPVVVRARIDVHQRSRGLYGAFDIVRYDGTLLLKCYSTDTEANPLSDLSMGMYEVSVSIPPRILGHGKYTVDFLLAQVEGVGARRMETLSTVTAFSITETRLESADRRPGLLSTCVPWELSPLQAREVENAGG